jgi:hypothetical protein
MCHFCRTLKTADVVIVKIKGTVMRKPISAAQQIASSINN